MPTASGNANKYQIIVSAKVDESTAGKKALADSLKIISKDLVITIKSFDATDAIKLLKTQIQNQLSGITVGLNTPTTAPGTPGIPNRPTTSSTNIGPISPISGTIDTKTIRTSNAGFDISTMIQSYDVLDQGIIKATKDTYKLGEAETDSSGNITKAAELELASIEQSDNLRKKGLQEYREIIADKKTIENLDKAQLKQEKELLALQTKRKNFAESQIQKSNENIAGTSTRDKNNPLVSNYIDANKAAKDFATTLSTQTTPITTAQTRQMTNLSNEVKNTGKAMQSVGKMSLSLSAQLAEAFKKIGLWAVATGAWYGAVHEIQMATQYVKDLDKELTNIRIVTGQTKEEVNLLAKEYNSLAKELGVTTLEVVRGSLSWSRQGKSASETAELLKASVMLGKLANLGQAQSTEYLTSIINGYKLSLEDVMPTVSKLVGLDNAYATSVGRENCRNVW
jgi:hypothetical protein